MATRRRGSQDGPDRSLEILPLTLERLPDLAELFGQGGDPRWCWCAWYRVRNVDFANADAARHRAILEAAVVADAGEGRAPGLVAYEGGTCVGWVSLGPRADYERLAASRVLAPVDDAPVWSVVCFVVGRRSRGKGVARALLDAALDYAREHGASIIEAYPVEVPEGERIAAANAYHGTLSMFERAGFEVVARRLAPGAKRPRTIARRAL